jgi:hypothetical protein
MRRRPVNGYLIWGSSRLLPIAWAVFSHRHPVHFEERFCTETAGQLPPAT